MYDVTKETSLPFLRAAVDMLQKRLLVSEKKNRELTIAQQVDAEICRILAEDLLLLRKKFFRTRREKTGKSKTKASVDRTNLPHNRPPTECPEPASVELGSEEITHELPQTGCTCDGELKKMTGGFEEATEIDVVQYRYKFVTHKRQKYVCQACQKIVTAPGTSKLKPGSEFSLQMAVEVAVDKYQHHLPLNRQAQQMAKHGVKVEAKTLFRLTDHLHERLKGVPAMIRAEILSRPCVGVDEAPMRILSTDQSGYVWVLANNFGAYYQYEMTRAGAVSDEILKGYKGAVISDGYKGYEHLKKNSDLTCAQCWAHCRRGFFDAKDKHPEAEKAVDLIDKLFEIDRRATNMEEIAILRQNESVLIADQFDAYIASRRGAYLESLAFGKAVKYYTDRRTQLRLFLTNAAIPLDNNTAERALRAPVMGRNNFQGFRTINGADIGMTFYSIVRSCKAVNVEPRNYMLTMAIKAARGETVITPYRWALELEAAARETVASVVQPLLQAH
jgi:transposase